MRRFTRKFTKWTADMLDLPQDVIFDLPRVTMIGNMQLYVENHRGVLHFTEEYLKLALTQGSMEIYGKNLSIRAILPEEMFIEGTIQQVKYM
ncbi:sporulation protein YqfC [Paenibacillus thermotolerans]|uniref:sporulation protein YqfC n=1 Tax=Paenibacillus thermotolerans TaxID=3027807 RepID=UPI002368C985|nr:MULTISPECIES: sporulation protein YqfC [unclassified Paenibacillus]